MVTTNHGAGDTNLGPLARTAKLRLCCARQIGALVLALLILLTQFAWAETATLTALRDAGRRLVDPASTRPLGRPISIVSSASAGEVRAESYAVIQRSFHDVSQALADPQAWCAVLLLHINNKGCRATTDSDPPRIGLKVARKYDQPVEKAYDLAFAFHQLEVGSESLSAQLDAPSGPLGTSDYVIRLDAASFGATQTVVHLSYAYRQTTMTGLAMDLYFATIGSGKVGFTKVSESSTGEVQYLGGVRGLVERNLMRYLLAIEAAAGEPKATTTEEYARRLRAWFEAAETYQRQLHEVDLSTYLDLKRSLGPRL